MQTKFGYMIKECKICNGKGYLFSSKREFRGEEEEDFAKQCVCIKTAVNHHRYDVANIPREYFNYSLDQFRETSPEKIAVKEKIQSICANIKDYHREGRGLFLYGTKGTGKTMLGVEILKEAARNGYSTYYEFYPVLFEAFTRRGYVADNTKDDYDKIFHDTDFLLLDELVKESDFFNGQGNEVASARLLEMNILKRRASKPTIIISNLENGLEDIKKYYGQYVYSMMKHNFNLISFKDEDFRENGR